MGAVGANKGSVVSVSTDSKEFRNTLRLAEDKIRNDDTETAVVYNKDGNLVLTKNQGMTNKVDFTAEETALFENSVFTHNHPSTATFSSADIETAVKAGIKEMRACHADGAYVMVRNYGINDLIPSKYLNFAKDYTQARQDYRINVVDKVWDNSMQTQADADKCNRMLTDFRHQWLKDNAKSYGWTYKEEKK